MARKQKGSENRAPAIGLDWTAVHIAPIGMPIAHLNLYGTTGW